MPPVQTGTSGSPVTPIPPAGGMPTRAGNMMNPNNPMTGTGPTPPMGGTPPNGGRKGMPMVQQIQLMPEKKKDIAGLVKIIAIVILSLIAVTFIGLFIWMYVKYDEASTDVEGQINIAVAEAKDEQAMQLEDEFSEREKYPYKTFTGPADYGALSFEYPKTWSVYVEKAADKGGDFNAYFNPVQVDAVGKDTINSLRVTISTKSFDDVVSDYQRKMERKDSGLSMQSVEIGDAEKDSTVTANYYTGTIPDTDLSGYIVIFKIRDKTVILQTDSVLFQAEFDKLLDTINFNA